jgi:deoxyribonuclease-4
MPLFGAHLSVSGGYFKACEAAAALNCETVQIFTKAPSQWAGKPITDEDAETFRKAAKAAKLKCPTAHDSYLINLAAPESGPWEKSKDAFADEIGRADKLGLKYLVTHPGAHVGSGEVAGVKRVIEALNEVLDRTADSPLVVLLETTAGMGTTLGHRFEHLRDMIGGVKQSQRLGVCLDTCHVFAAGYPLGTDEEYAETVKTFDRTIGLKDLKLFHLNDSVKGLGCRVDRHAGIGRGCLGEGPFRRLVTDPRFAKLPMVLETPKEDAAGAPMDPVNLATLRSFLASVGA